jgi:hypothetical protein
MRVLVNAIMNIGVEQNAVGIAIGFWLEGRRIVVGFPVREKDFLFSTAS